MSEDDDWDDLSGEFDDWDINDFQTWLGLNSDELDELCEEIGCDDLQFKGEDGNFLKFEWEDEDFDNAKGHVHHTQAEIISERQ